VDSIQTEISTNIHSMAEEIDAAISKRGAILPKTTKKLRRLIDNARALNFIEDPAANDWLDKIETSLNQQSVDPLALRGVLQKVRNQAAKDIEQHKKTDASFAMVLQINDN